MTFTPAANERGFTLMETMVALGVLAAGLLSTAQVMAFYLSMSSDAGWDLLARQKATEAIESVFTSRDTGKIPWAQIRNVAGESGNDGGIFLDGLRPLTIGGVDGLVNTADDGAVDGVVLPGPDGSLGTGDDVTKVLTNFQREIRITAVTGNPNLRRIKVIITYRAEQRSREFVIDTFISSFA